MILSIDTSASVSVALTDADANVVLSRRSEFSPRGHAELCTELVRQAMEEAGAARTDITAVVVGTGPAPFTGLRVGLVTARMLALAWSVPVHGVCSLDGFEASLGDALVIADARRREVHWALYSGGTRVDGPQVGSPADVLALPSVAEAMGRGVLVVGRGAALYPDAFGAVEASDPDPAVLARRAVVAAATGLELPTEPMYLRKPDVHGQPVS